MKDLHLELKVCEGCGALWLRRGVTDGVYCSLCSRRLSSFPPPKGRHPGGRPRRCANRNIKQMPAPRCTGRSAARRATTPGGAA